MQQHAAVMVDDDALTLAKKEHCHHPFVCLIVCLLRFGFNNSCDGVRVDVGWLATEAVVSCVEGVVVMEAMALLLLVACCCW